MIVGKYRRLFVLGSAVALSFCVGFAPENASAAVVWTFDSANCVATTGPSGNCGSGDNNLSDGRTYQPSSGAGGNVSVSGWANTISTNTQLELGQITHFGGGLGVSNADGPRGQDTSEGSSPEHAVDNDQRFDLVLFDFGTQLVELNQITLGWWQQDADISVLAYTGNLDPTDSSGADYIGDREAWWNSDTDQNEDLTSHGWELIGNHDVDSNGGSSPSQAINPNNVASSYWLVSAYNPVFGSSCSPQNSYCQSDYEDYFKILSLMGDIRSPTTTTTSIPEPTSLLLMGMGLAGLAGVGFGRRRRRSNA